MIYGIRNEFFFADSLSYELQGYKVGSIAEKMHNPLTSTLFANDCYHHGPYETPKKGS